MSFAEVANSSALPGFAKKADLAKDRTRFCVTSVREATKDNKTSWYIDILRTEGTEQIAETVTFEKGSSNRDKKIQHLQNDLLNQDVIHGVYLESVKMKTGATYFDPHHDPEAVCLCSTEEKPEF